VIAQPTQFIRAPLAFVASRGGQFVVLAFLLGVQNTYASTLVASQFLVQVGAQSIPLYYILFAGVSIPFAALFSSVIDRYPRRQLFVCMLASLTIVTIVLPALPQRGTALPYFAYLIVQLVEHLSFGVYFILVGDYFSALSSKRNAGRIALGMAVGGLVGGGLLTAVAPLGGPVIAGWVTPVLVAAALVHGSWMTRRHQPLDAAAPASRESFVDSLAILSRLVRRYPLIALMSAAMFLNVLLHCIAEFLAFTIYTIRFPRAEDLTAFLGLVNAGLSVLGFLVIVLFTDRQLPRFGVPKMNRVYPVLNLLTFGLLAIAPGLPAAVLANVSYDPCERGIDVPVTALNYNAVRHRFVGRVRVFIDGMVFPLGLAAAGLLLLGFAGRIDLRVVAASGLVLSAALLAVHLRIGKQYARGLVEMLRDGAVELDQVESGLQIPSEHAAEIHAMLAGDPRTALMGLEMAARCDGEISLDQIASALTKIPPAQARKILARFAKSDVPARRAVVERLAETGPADARPLAWEHIFSNGGSTMLQARALLDDPDEAVRCVAAAAILIDDPADKAAREILGGALSAAAATGALEVFRQTAGPDIAATLAAIGSHADPTVRSAALAAAENCAADSPGLVDWAYRAADDPAPAVRLEALSLLARVLTESRLAEVAVRSFTDPSPEVRHAGAQALGARGEAATSAICAQLRHDREDVQAAAIEALGFAMGPAGADRLFEELNAGIFAPIAFNRRLARSYPAGGRAGTAIRAASDNSTRRVLRLVLQALDALGHRRTLNLVRTMMNSGDERSRANAIESLASLPHRRFVIPILPLIEGGAAAGRIGSERADPADIEHALSSPDPWLRAAAAVAWHDRTGKVPAHLLQDPSSVVAQTADELARRPTGTCPYPQEVLMSRLAFLHGVRLFADTSLDDLIAVDHVLGSETYLAGESIVSEGESGDRLCIVHSGNVVVKKDGRVLAQLAVGDFFGEMALLDDEPRSATVIAIDDVEVLVLQRDRFHSLVHQRPSILIEVCTTLVRRLRQAEQEAPAVRARP
jgi:MFS family permease